MAIVQAKRRGAAAASEVRLVWHVRHPTDIGWIQPMLATISAQSATLTDFRVVIDCYVTRLPVGTPAIAEDLHDQSPQISSTSQSLVHQHVGRADIATIVQTSLAHAPEGLTVAGELTLPVQQLTQKLVDHVVYCWQSGKRFARPHIGNLAKW